MKRAILFFLVAVFVYCPAAPFPPRDFPKLHFTTDDGLPSNTVYDIYRDSKGFLWFATDKGVARYNGIKFETFTTSNGLADNEIFMFKEDGFGRLWMATYNGELCYFQNDVFHTAANTPFLRFDHKTTFIDGLFAEFDGSITLIFSEGSRFANITREHVNVIDIDKAKKNGLTIIGYVNKLPGGIFDVYYQDETLSKPLTLKKQGEITSKRVALFHRGCMLKVDDNSNVYGFTARGDTDVFFTNSQQYNFIYTNDSLFTVDRKIRRTLPPAFFPKRKLLRPFVNDSILFLGTDSGVIINNSIRILNDDKIPCINQDNSGNYWIATLNDGVFCLNKNLLSEDLFSSAYPGKVNFATAIKDRFFFAISNNDLYLFENRLVKRIFKYDLHEPDKGKFFPAYFVDTNYKYFNFFNGDYLVIANILARNKKVTHYTNSGIWQPQNIEPLNNALYFIDSKLRVTKAKYNYNRPGIDIYYHVKDITDEFKAHERIYAGAKFRGDYWYSTNNSVCRIKNDSPQIQKQFGNITFKTFDFIGDFLVGNTLYNRLLICKPYDRDPVADSIPQQNCVWERLLRLDSCHLLVKTNNQYRILTISSQSGNVSYNLSVVENPWVPLQSDAICSNGQKIIFFKKGAILAFDLTELLEKPDPPVTFFTSVKSKEKSYEINDRIDIFYKESRNLVITFSSLSFAGKNVTYQYSISKTEDDSWRDIAGEINLVNIGYGTYTVKVRAKTMSSDYSVPAVFVLHILRPFWARWWFVALCVFVLLVSAMIVARLRIQSEVRKKEKELTTEIKFMKSEYKALNALMNPHFIFNTLNNVQSLVNENNKQAANEYLRVFADLVRQNMQNIAKELIPLQKEISLVHNYLLLEKLRFEDKLEYSIDISEDVELGDVLVPPLLIQPLVENAIKHGILPLHSASGFVQIRVYEQTDKLVVEVRDNGVGIVTSASQYRSDTMHESFGIQNIKNRLHQLSIIQSKHIQFDISEVIDPDGLRWTVARITIPIDI